MVRNALYRLVELFAYEKEDELAQMLDYLEAEQRVDWPQVLDDYFDEYDDVELGPDSRGPEFFRLGDQSGRKWEATQIIPDPQGDNAFQIHAVVDLDASDEAGEVRFDTLQVHSR